MSVFNKQSTHELLFVLTRLRTISLNQSIAIKELERREKKSNLDIREFLQTNSSLLQANNALEQKLRDSEAKYNRREKEILVSETEQKTAHQVNVLRNESEISRLHTLVDGKTEALRSLKLRIYELEDKEKSFERVILANSAKITELTQLKDSLQEQVLSTRTMLEKDVGMKQTLQKCTQQLDEDKVKMANKLRSEETACRIAEAEVKSLVQAASKDKQVLDSLNNEVHLLKLELCHEVNLKLQAEERVAELSHKLKNEQYENDKLLRCLTTARTVHKDAKRLERLQVTSSSTASTIGTGEDTICGGDTESKGQQSGFQVSIFKTVMSPSPLARPSFHPGPVLQTSAKVGDKETFIMEIRNEIAGAVTHTLKEAQSLADAAPLCRYPSSTSPLLHVQECERDSIEDDDVIDLTSHPLTLSADVSTLSDISTAATLKSPLKNLSAMKATDEASHNYAQSNAQPGLAIQVSSETASFSVIDPVVQADTINGATDVVLNDTETGSTNNGDDVCKDSVDYSTASTLNIHNFAAAAASSDDVSDGVVMDDAHEQTAASVARGLPRVCDHISGPASADVTVEDIVYSDDDHAMTQVMNTAPPTVCSVLPSELESEMEMNETNDLE